MEIFTPLHYYYNLMHINSFSTTHWEKLDGVGPVDNEPSTHKLHHFVHFFCVLNDMWHVTSDTWLLTHDTWHVTRDTWHVWGGEHFSSLAFTVCDLWYYKDLEEKADSINELMNEWVTRLFEGQPRLHRVCQLIIADLFKKKILSTFSVSAQKIVNHLKT